MKTKPGAEVTVDASLVRALIEEQHPDLAHFTLEKVAEGWDNALFRLGEDLAVRLPRRAASATLIEHEQRWLPLLAARLPLEIPMPIRGGVPGRLFRWPWSIVRWLPGISLLGGPVDDHAATAIVLERFFLALHQPAPHDAPKNPWRGVPIEARTRRLHEHLTQVGSLVDRRVVLGLWDRALSAPPWSAPPVWLHGDLHPGNMLVTDGRLTGVIDFGDLTSGDPAVDLSLLWMLPESIRSRFTAWMGDEPEPLRTRARGWALALGLAHLAHSADDAALGALGLQTIKQALDEP